MKRNRMTQEQEVAYSVIPGFSVSLDLCEITGEVIEMKLNEVDKAATTECFCHVQ